MSKKLKPFTIIHNLESLSDAERQAYLGKVSEFMGLPPEMNALDMLWVPDETTGLKRYVPYARKGTTDILREIHGISVKSMEQHDGPGYVSFKATGVNPEGRQEVAIGAHSTEGLRAERLAAAIMTAETRAGRRLTLKFVGAGILDESEVNAVVSNIASANASLAQLAGSPTVVPPPPGTPSTAVGKDITSEEKAKPAPTVKEAVKQEDTTELPAPVTPAVAPVTSAPEAAKETVKEAPKRRGAPRGPRKKKGEVTFATIIDHEEGTIAHVRPISEVPSAPAAGVVQFKPTACHECGVYLKDHNYVHGKGYVCLIPTESIEEKTIRIGKELGYQVSEPPATVSREEGAVGTGTESVPPLAESASAGITTEQEIRQGVVNPTLPTAPPSTPLPSLTTIDKGLLLTFRNRLREYANVILPRQGGMLPSEGIGGSPNKLRAFALKFTGMTDVDAFSQTQWEALFDFLDSYNKAQGPKALVVYINETIGAK